MVKGRFDIIEADETYIAVMRAHGDQTMFCAFNLSDEPRKIVLPEGDWTVDETAPFTVEGSSDDPVLPPWQVLFADKS